MTAEVNPAPLNSPVPFKAELLMVSADDEYVAIFRNNDQFIVMESEQGRRIRMSPLRAPSPFFAVQETERSLLSRGFKPFEKLVGAKSALSKFMQSAGFTPGHVADSLRLYSR